MSLIQDKLGGEFLRPGGAGGAVDPTFGPSVLMFSHLPPVTSFTRLASQTVMADLQPHEMILKRERDSPDCGGGGGVLSGGGGLGGGAAGGGMMAGVGDYVHAMGIKQEKVSEHDYRLPLYPGGGPTVGGRGSNELLEMSLGNHQNLLVHDLSLGNLSGRMGKDSTGRKGRRSNGDGQEGKPRRKRGEAKSMMLDPDGGSLSPNSKPHVCEHCSAAFRSSYHLRRHVLIHTGERPFRCSQCNMSFIQKYLLQRHEKIHSGEKPFSCDQCNMRFIQKYHMERHKRTHSGEKPYKCDTCQQYFSRTDRLLKHKRTCGDGVRKVVEGELGADAAHGSYSLTQGTPAPVGRRRGKSKPAGEGKRKRAPSVSAPLAHQGYSLHDFSAVENQGASMSSSSHSSSSVAATTQPGPGMHGELGRVPKMAFKKGQRKGPEKSGPGHDKPGGVQLGGVGGLDGLALLHGPGAKAGSTSSNYDDAMQFLKKRRYLHAANNGGSGGGASEYDVGVTHLQPQPTVIQGVVSGVMDGDASLGLLDSSPLADIKHDKSGIPDEVLQSLLDHYAHKPDVTFDLSDTHHVELHAGSGDGSDPLVHDGSPSSPGGGDKAALMHEYSRFLLQALERTSHGTAFSLGPSHAPSLGPSHAPSSAAGSFPTTGPLLSDKHVYATSPMEYSFGQPVTSSPSIVSSVPKSHFALLGSVPSPQGFHLNSLEPTPLPPPPHPQQLTPSQELTEQLEKQHASPSPPSHPPTSAYQIPPTAPPPDLTIQKESSRGPENGTSGPSGTSSTPRDPFSLPHAQELTSLDPAKGAYQIENFAQAFGAQFKGGRRHLGFSADTRGEVDHRMQTSVSEFSGYSSLLADVSEPVSSDPKSPPSQSYS
ncbi:zinc finger protein 281 [Brachyhypopomus gauderio]|uniref:zinc finger protein 281 n=1 Tax=Brachyhypopomus gauderio TaxID=698409 RepID=UPI00404173B2